EGEDLHSGKCLPSEEKGQAGQDEAENAGCPDRPHRVPAHSMPARVVPVDPLQNNGPDEWEDGECPIMDSQRILEPRELLRPGLVEPDPCAQNVGDDIGGQQGHNVTEGDQKPDLSPGPADSHAFTTPTRGTNRSRASTPWTAAQSKSLSPVAG